MDHGPRRDLADALPGGVRRPRRDRRAHHGQATALLASSVPGLCDRARFRPVDDGGVALTSRDRRARAALSAVLDRRADAVAGAVVSPVQFVTFLGGRW